MPKLTPAQIIAIVTAIATAIIAILNALGGTVPVVPGI